MFVYAPVKRKEPDAVPATPGPTHRRYELPCTTDLTAQLLALLEEHMPARDRRHETAAAYPDVEAWLDYLVLVAKAARTIHVYERQVAPLLRMFPDKTIDQFVSEDINKVLTAIPPRSRHITRSIYNQFFEWAMFADRIDRSPMVKVPKMSAGPRRRKDIFEEAEVAILVGLPVPDGPLFALLFGTGLRRGDARHLRRQHIDLARLRLAVYNGKGGKDALLPFTPDVAFAVADLDRHEQLEPGDHLWYRKRYPVGDRRRRTDPIGDTTFETWYRDKLEQAGVRYLNPHQTRHTYHQWLRDNKFPIDERMEPPMTSPFDLASAATLRHVRALKALSALWAVCSGSARWSA